MYNWIGSFEISLEVALAKVLLHVVIDYGLG